MEIQSRFSMLFSSCRSMRVNSRKLVKGISCTYVKGLKVLSIRNWSQLQLRSSIRLWSKCRFSMSGKPTSRHWFRFELWSLNLLALPSSYLIWTIHTRHCQRRNPQIVNSLLQVILFRHLNFPNLCFKRAYSYIFTT